MKILRELNEEFKEFDYKIVLLFFALLSIPTLLSLFLPINIMIVGVVYFIFGIALLYENYTFNKKHKTSKQK